MSALDHLFHEIAAVFQPLVLAATDAWLLEQLLSQLAADASQLDSGAFVAQLETIGQAVSELETLASAPSDTLAAVGTALDAVEKLSTAARALAGSLPRDAAALASDLIQLVVLRYIRIRWPIGYQLAVSLGVIAPGLATSTSISTGPKLVDTVVWSQISAVLSAPVAAMRAQYPAQPLATTADTQATMDAIVTHFGGLATAFGVPWRYGVAGAGAAAAAALAPVVSSVDHAAIVFAPPSWIPGETFGAVITLSSADADDLGIVITPFGTLAVDDDIGAWHVTLQASADVQAVAFGGGKGFQVLASGSTTDVQLGLTISQLTNASGAPYVLGPASGTRLEIVGAAAHANVSLAAGACTVDLGIGVQQATFVLTADGSDGFLHDVLGSGEMRTTIVFGLEYATGQGLHLLNGSGLAVQIPTVLSIGPLSLQQVALKLAPSGQAIDIAVTSILGVTLGPVTVAVHGLGIHAGLLLPSETPPQSFDFDFGWQPPDGAGIAIAASAITGGGYVQYADGVYTGGLALSAEGIAITAFGTLDARAPSGYSLAAIISAQFPAIQLGLGFTLNGIGGLVAVHRQVNTDALQAALLGKGIDDIFFPTNSAAQLARLTGDLGTYFPEAPGRYVFGPAIKIGWGTPTLVTGELAILLELPDPVRVVLLGSVSAALPTKDHPLVVLNVEVLGVIDFAAKTLAIDASLVNSKVIAFPITGDFALRLGWGDSPSFVLSVGGFHSQFTPPPEFPTLRRVQIPIGSGNNPRLDAQGFLAITSNTAQVGAQIDLYVAAGPLSLTGSVGFEALFQFSPFSFEIDLSAGVALKRGSTTLAGVQLDGTLSGPTPWHITGEASLSLWFVSLSVPFSATFGQAQSVEVPQTAVWPLLQAALQAPTNWSAALPDGAARAVTTAPPVDDTSGAVRVDPVGALVVRQTVCPLDQTITKFGQATPSGPNEFTVTSATLGAAPATFTAVTDYFAAAQFEDLSDADKLSRPGYELMTSGVSLATAAVRESAELTAPLTYDTTLIVNGVVQPAAPAFRPTLAAQLLGCARSANTSAPLRTASSGGTFAAPALLERGGLPDDTFVIASAATLTARTDLASAAPRGAIERALAAHLAATPGDAGALIVVPSYELAA